jgi:hypothetical protein
LIGGLVELAQQLPNPGQTLQQATAKSECDGVSRLCRRPAASSRLSELCVGCLRITAAKNIVEALVYLITSVLEIHTIILLEKRILSKKPGAIFWRSVKVRV